MSQRCIDWKIRFSPGGVGGGMEKKGMRKNEKRVKDQEKVYVKRIFITCTKGMKINAKKVQKGLIDLRGLVFLFLL
jgi:hypothetical protein